MTTAHSAKENQEIAQYVSEYCERSENCANTSLALQVSEEETEKQRWAKVLAPVAKKVVAKKPKTVLQLIREFFSF